ncbi:MAG TPA: hypothetical protein VM286_05095 [Candidatus Thermoplasmatota archaeon]|nr:hypothetical protein [Candidatus Thermoplasmatota archaeon]
MHGVWNILHAVRQRGGLTYDDLEAEMALSSADVGSWFGLALDECVDDGLLCRVFSPGADLKEDRYRITRRGKTFLQARALTA